jgi:ectoine hydroxylase-related dioxygenase (phytanoyl-CoA dioxygenase family)
MGVSLFTKEPHSKKIVSWHQDLTYWDLDNSEETTCWVALTPVSEANGCMKFIPGSQKQRILPHTDTFAEDNMLSRGQEIAVEVDEDDAVNVELAPGQASLHHGHLFHASGPNVSDIPRVAVAIRYIKTSMKQSSGERPVVVLASGTDEFGYFDEARPPSGRLADEEFEYCYEDMRTKRKMLFKGVDEDKGQRYG